MLWVKSIPSIKFEDSRPASLREETTWNVYSVSMMLLQIVMSNMNISQISQSSSPIVINLIPLILILPILSKSPSKSSSENLIQWAEMVSYICGLPLMLIASFCRTPTISRGLMIASIWRVLSIRRWLMICTVLQIPSIRWRLMITIIYWSPSIRRGILVKIILRYIRWLGISHNYRPSSSNVKISKK